MTHPLKPLGTENWKGPKKFSLHFFRWETETRKGDLSEVTQLRQGWEQWVADLGSPIPKLVFSAPQEGKKSKAIAPSLLPWVDTGTEPVLSYLH